MPEWEQLHKKLVGVSNKHSNLVSIFGEFAKQVESQVKEPASRIRGITTSLHLDQSYFTITFTGRDILFLFKSLLEGDELKGNVQCYIKKEFPEPIYDKFGEFTFTGGGQTNLKMLDWGSEVIVDINIVPLYLAHNYIYESLSL
jgi:hypothetical protein